MIETEDKTSATETFVDFPFDQEVPPITSGFSQIDGEDINSATTTLDDRIRYIPMILAYQEPKHRLYNRAERRMFENHLISQARYKIRLYLDKEARGTAHGNRGAGDAAVAGQPAT